VAGIFGGCGVLCVDFAVLLPDFRVEVGKKTKVIRGSILMTRILFLLLCFGFVSACDSGGGDVLQSPSEDGADGGAGEGGDDGTPIDSDRELPPGTESPTRDDSIFRRESFDEEIGNGYVRSVSYNEDDDTFFVDGLGFDGNQVDGDRFTPSDPGSLGGRFDLPGARYSVYEAPVEFPDSLTETPIPQFLHRAIYGVSDSGDTEFAIVRTGAYINYGFGGFIYQRNGDVVIPAEGQATYEGAYAALRDFDGRSGLEYADGRAEIDIDFSGFRGNCAEAECDNAVRGLISERRLFDLEGNDITRAYLDALSAANGDVALSEMPVISFKIGPNVGDLNGELVGTVFTAGSEAPLTESIEEDGQFFAVMAGDHASEPGGEIAGVVVIENDDPRFDGVTVRETGGFIAVRR